MPGLQAALPTGDIEGCADANTQVITVTSITDDFEAYCTFALESKPELCAARTARAYARVCDMNRSHTHAASVRALPCCMARRGAAARGGRGLLSCTVNEC